MSQVWAMIFLGRDCPASALTCLRAIEDEFRECESDKHGYEVMRDCFHSSVVDAFGDEASVSNAKSAFELFLECPSVANGTASTAKVIDFQTDPFFTLVMKHFFDIKVQLFS